MITVVKNEQVRHRILERDEQAALKASKLVEKAKSVEEARNNVKDLLKRIEDRIEAEIDTFLRYK